MKARQKTYELLNRLDKAGINATFEQAETLRRAELVLNRWHELECGNSNPYTSFNIQRDEETGKPFMYYNPHKGESYRTPIADKEAGAIKRVKNICKELEIYYFQQGDPRGAALYVSKEPINDSDYYRSVCCHVQ